jgi:hypothetical protein
VSCGSTAHTGSAFCAQLGKELPAIAQPVATSKEVIAMVRRYQRLLDRAPLTIESDLKVFTDLLQQAARVNPAKKDQVQALADAAYHANKSALNVRDWVLSTCAVDISTGMNVAPMRQPTTTIAAPISTTATTAPVAPTNVVPAATTVP